MRKYLRFMLMMIVFSLSLSLCAFSEEDALTEFEKAQFSQNIIVPSPADLFLALDKIGGVNWREAASYNLRFDYNNDYLRALNLGVRGAEGFIAIQAGDKTKLAEMIRTIIRLAEELGASETILNKRKKIEGLAQQEKWQELRMELDGVRDDVWKELTDKGDTDIALLLSLGGWLDGLRATTKALKDSYNPGDSTLLFQPTLVEFFQTNFKQLGPKASDQSVVKKIGLQIPEIKELLNVGWDNPIPEENIKKLYMISTELVWAIERGE
jgi:hypothetical protein